jgi:hypothetical protein
VEEEGKSFLVALMMINLMSFYLLPLYIFYFSNEKKSLSLSLFALAAAAADALHYKRKAQMK